MKQLNNFIQEKLKLDKNTKVYADIPINIGTKTKFTKEQIEEIQLYCNDLPIIPDIITNRNDPFGEKGGTSYGSGFIALVYKRNDGKTTGEHYYNEILIKMDSMHSGNYNFFIKFIKIDRYVTDAYPADPNKFFKSIKECFDCIKAKWNIVGFSEAINKYK